MVLQCNNNRLRINVNARGQPDALVPPDDGPNCLILPIVSILYRRLWTILVTACLMTIPALSISFLESPEVTQTFSAG